MAKWGSVDYKQLQDLQKRLQEMDELNAQFCQEAAKELAARLLAKVIRRTPVGQKPTIKGPKTMKVEGASGKKRSMLTAEGARIERYWAGYVGGTLRRGWTGGKNQNAATYAQSLPVTQSGDVFEIDIINPVEYAPYVEYGHRQTPGRFVPALGKTLKQAWVPGKLMLTKSEIELAKQTPAILEKKLQKYLEEVFNQ